MLPRRSEYHLDLLLQGAGSEEEDHDQSVGEAHFGAVDGAIADGFEEDEGLFVFGVEDDALERSLVGRSQHVVWNASQSEYYLELLVGVGHGGMCCECRRATRDISSTEPT